MDPITRTETYLASVAGQEVELPVPISREDQYLYRIATGEGEIPESPITREEAYLDAIVKGGGGGGSSVTVEELTVTENGTYTAPSGKAYSPVKVNVASGATYEPTNHMGTKLSELPDLSLLDKENPVLYFVVDTSKSNLPMYEKFGVRPVSNGGAITVSIGYVGDNGFVEIESESIASGTYYTKRISGYGHRFLVFKLTSTGTLYRVDALSNTYLLDPNYQPVVAMCGNWSEITQFGLIVQEALAIDAANAKVLNISIINGNSLTYVKLSGTCIFKINQFYNNAKLSEVDLEEADLSQSTGTNIAQAFYLGNSIKTVRFGAQDLSGVTSIRSIFHGCERIESLDLSGLDLSGVTETTSAFKEMRGLYEIKGWPSIPVSYSLGDSVGLTHDSLLTVINSLPTVSTSQTLTLGSANQSRLTAEEIAIATGKGWTVA